MKLDSRVMKCTREIVKNRINDQSLVQTFDDNGISLRFTTRSIHTRTRTHNIRATRESLYS